MKQLLFFGFGIATGIFLLAGFVYLVILGIEYATRSAEVEIYDV